MDSLAPPVPERFDDMGILWTVLFYLLASLGAILVLSVMLASF